MTKLYPFQMRGVQKIEDFGGRGLLADEMGLGKSVQSLVWAWMFLPEDSPIVVVCPATIKEHWKREAAKHVGMRAEILYGRTPPKGYQFRMRSNTIYIVNYEILGSDKGSQNTWCKFLRKLKPKLVIIDECHYISNPRAQRTKHVRGLVKGVPHVIAISGTPLTNRPAELWSILNIVRPDLFPNFIKFANRYCKPEYTPWGVQYRGATRLPELHKLLKKTCMIRRLKADVLKDLPPKTRIVVPITLSNRKEYEEAERDFAKWLRKTHPKKASKARKAERLVKYGYLTRLAAELKKKDIIEWIDNFLQESDQKLIVFGVHKKMVRGLQELYRKKSVRIDGSVPQKERMGIVDEFIGKKQIRMLFGNIKAAGTGWSAKGVSNGLFTEFGWRPGDITQAEDRTHGIGRGTKGIRSTWYYLVAKGTIEEDLVKLLQKKQRIISATLDGSKEGQDLNLYDQLEAAFLKRMRRGK